MNIVAWILLVLGAFEIVAGVFFIGKQRKPLEPTAYLFNVAIWALVIVLCGLTLGWW